MKGSHHHHPGQLTCCLTADFGAGPTVLEGIHCLLTKDISFSKVYLIFVKYIWLGLFLIYHLEYLMFCPVSRGRWVSMDLNYSKYAVGASL